METGESESGYRFEKIETKHEATICEGQPFLKTWARGSQRLSEILKHENDKESSHMCGHIISGKSEDSGQSETKRKAAMCGGQACLKKWTWGSQGVIKKLSKTERK